MMDRRRGERLELDEKVEMTLIEPSFSGKGSFVIHEMSYEYGRKYGIYLNLLLSGFRFSGDIELNVGQEISFLVPEVQDVLKGSIAWRKPCEDSGYFYGVRVLLGENRRRNNRESFEELVELTLISARQPENGKLYVEEMSYGLGRKHGVHLTPHITGLRIRSNIDLNEGQVISFRIPASEAELSGTIVWKEAAEEPYTLYGVQVS